MLNSFWWKTIFISMVKQDLINNESEVDEGLNLVKKQIPDYALVMYRDGANYKTYFNVQLPYHIYEQLVFDYDGKLVDGKNEFEIEDFMVSPIEMWDLSGVYDEEIDHNLVDVIGVSFEPDTQYTTINETCTTMDNKPTTDEIIQEELANLYDEKKKINLTNKDLETEIDEGTSIASVGAGGHGSGFAYVDPYGKGHHKDKNWGTWAKNEKSMRWNQKPYWPNGSFVTVKKKCQKFPYCNQGDTGALNFSNPSAGKSHTLSEELNVDLKENKDIYSKNKIMGTAHRLKEYENKFLNGLLKEGIYDTDQPIGDENDLARDLDAIDTEGNLDELDNDIRTEPAVAEPAVIDMDPHSIALEIKDQLPQNPTEENLFDALCDIGYCGKDSGFLFDQVAEELYMMGVDIILAEGKKKTKTLKKMTKKKETKKESVEKNNLSLLEAGTPGITMYDKIHGESGTSNKAGVKHSMDNAKRLNQVADKTENEKLSGIGEGEPKYGNFDKKKKEYDDDYIAILRGMGLQDIQFDTEPSEDFQKRAEEAIVGSAKMGNDPNWANAQRDWDGTKGELGKKIIDNAKKKKAAFDQTGKEDHMSIRYKYPNKKHEETHIAMNEENKFQNLKTKKIIYFEKDLDKLIPESHKVEGAQFKLFDGNKTVYELKWEGNTLVVESEKNQNLVESECNVFKKMTGYSVGEYKVKPKGYLTEEKKKLV